MLSTPGAPLLLITREYAAIMLPRLTIFSISPVAASGQALLILPVTFDAPAPTIRSFRPLHSGMAPDISSRPSASPVVIEIQGSCPIASCSALHRLVSPTIMTSADFCQPIPMSLDIGSTRQADRPPRVMRATFPPYTRRIYSHILPDGYRALKILAFSPGWDCLICDSCSSGRDFACGFLQIPPHNGHPCRPAIGSHHQGPKRTSTSKSPIRHHT